MKQPPTRFEKMRAQRQNRVVVEFKRKRWLIDAEVDCGAEEELQAERIERQLQDRLDRNHEQRRRWFDAEQRRQGGFFRRWLWLAFGTGGNV